MDLNDNDFIELFGLNKKDSDAMEEAAPDLNQMMASLQIMTAILEIEPETEKASKFFKERLRALTDAEKENIGTAYEPYIPSFQAVINRSLLMAALSLNAGNPEILLDELVVITINAFHMGYIEGKNA